MDHFLHIGMILSTLDMRSSWFLFWLSSEKGLPILINEGLITPLCSTSTHTVKFEPDSDSLVEKPYGHFSPYWYDIIHFGPEIFMVLFLGFSFKVSYRLDVVYTYRLIILSIPC